MKKATHTPNRFTTFTPSWRVKGLALFLAVLLFGACEDQLEGVGSRRESRFKVQYREFDIPVTTVQYDSVNTNVSASGSADRLLCGFAKDPLFGDITAIAFTQFQSAPKIDLTGKTGITFISAELELVLTTDLYEYGDTTDATLNYTLHEIDRAADFWSTNTYTASSTVAYNPVALASGSFIYDRDSMVIHRALNSNANANDDAYDTLQFDLPGSFGKKLLDTAKMKGLYWFNKGVWEINREKTDSVFRREFPGFAIKADPLNKRILSFKSGLATAATSTRIIVNYSYLNSAGATIKSQLIYFNFLRPGFTNVTYNRLSTPLQDLTELTDFNAPDDFAYMQSGTGVFAKLDFSGVRSYFDATPDTLINVALNGAELFLELESDVARNHKSRPSDLQLRLVGDDNRFYKAPLIVVSGSVFTDPSYTSAYYALGNGAFLDAVDDNRARASIPLTKKTTGERYYSLFLTDFFSKFLRPTDGFEPINTMALIPGPLAFGKSFDGVSFKKDKVKLRVYYTKAL